MPHKYAAISSVIAENTKFPDNTSSCLNAHHICRCILKFAVLQNVKFAI